MASPTANKTLITIRVSPSIANEVRSIAARENESQGVILRRLLKQALEQQSNAGEAA